MENVLRRARYPGASPFETHQKDIFFGRQNAIAALLRKIRLEQIVVMYGKSGDGKSSLINAGIIPRIDKPSEHETGLEPIKIRFGAYRPENAPKSPVALAAEQVEHPQTTFLHSVLTEDVSLWRIMKKRQLIENQLDKKGTLLIFDQFEELFTYPQEQIEQFGQQLAELLKVLIPTRYIRVIENLELSPADRKALHTQMNVRCLFSIRTDRLSLLNQLQKHLPNIQKINYELPPLTVEEAEDAILFPALKQGDFDTHCFDYEDAALHKLMQHLTKEGKQAIASFQLQIVCEAIEQQVLKKHLKRVNLMNIPNPDHLYENYYKNRILQIPEEEREAVRALIEDGLIYEEEERRLSLYEGQIKKQYQISEARLAQLVNDRLLRSEPSLQGGYTYELSHDTLVKPVANWKKIRVAEQRLAKEQMRRTWVLVWAGLAVLGFALSATSFSLYHNLSKEKQKTEEVLKNLSITIEKYKAEQRAHSVAQAQDLLREGHLFFKTKIYYLALDRMERAQQLMPNDTNLAHRIRECKVLLGKTSIRK